MILFIILISLQIIPVYGSSPESHCLWPSHHDACRFCVRGWFGDNCSRKCSNCDSGGCEKDTGRCSSCVEGYYSDGCSLACPEHCREDVDGTVNCDRDTGHCKENCKEGWWGDKCYRRCSENCKHSDCIVFDGICVWGCKDGWAGDLCTENCPGECKMNKCTIYGKCTHGCNTGFYGERCEKRCSSNCKNNDCIYVHDVICRGGCINGFMSAYCDEPCPAGCESCHQHTGECLTCRSGYWGPSCDQLCNSSCINSHCYADGVCTEGCMPGYHGHFCDMECDVYCTHCNRTNGECLVCKTSWDEDKHMCSDRMFTREDTSGTQSNDEEDGAFPTGKTLIIGVSLGCVVLLVSVILVVLRCRSRRGQREEYPPHLLSEGCERVERRNMDIL